MPLTVEEFLEQDHLLKCMRTELAAAGQHGRPIQEQIDRREAELRRHWSQGLEGSLTEDEGSTVAAQLTEEAERAGILAHATIERDDHGDAWIKFHGSKASIGSTHRLALHASSPVRVRAHWDVFVEFCPHRPAPAPEQLLLAPEPTS